MMEQQSVSGGSRWIGTSNNGFAVYAQEELRRLIPDVKFTQLEPGEVYRMETALTGPDVLERVASREPVFLRHMQPVHGAAAVGEDPQCLWAIVLRLSEARPAPGTRIAVQLRKSSKPGVKAALADWKRELDVLLADAWGTEPVVQEPDWIVSGFVHEGIIYYGLSTPADNLSDWAGGAIRFRREDHQISRAKFKLLEAERRFGLHLGQFREALDLGAAPGGWTSLLLERGLAVTAVDPGRLHEDLLGHPRLTYLARNAEKVRFSSGRFDLLVCDMSWSPRQMARLVEGLLYALKPGAAAIITVKLMHKKTLQTVRDMSVAWEPVLRLAKAKQLFHNREEITMLLYKAD